MRNYLRTFWQKTKADYDNGSLPVYETFIYAVGRTTDELVSETQSAIDTQKAFSPYGDPPPFESFWTFTRDDLVVAYFPLDQANFMFMLQNLPAFFGAEAVYQTPASQVMKVLYESPRADGFIDADGELRNPDE